MNSRRIKTWAWVHKWSSLVSTAYAALARVPGHQVAFIAFPGTLFSSPHHHTLFLRGNEAFTSRLLQPVLVDAKTSEVTASPRLPWYLAGLLLSQPLHFGDYGGRPMQILWALLDIATLVVLGSGLYLWLQRAKPVPARPKAALQDADAPLASSGAAAKAGT